MSKSSPANVVDSSRASRGVVAVRIAPVLCLALAAAAYVLHVEPEGSYRLRNLLPMLLAVLLAAIALHRGNGSWFGAGREWAFAVAGYAIPAVGLSLYLHYAYATDLNGTYSNAVYPEELFRYLPAFSMVAGATGFAIGWIIGRSAGAQS